MYNANISEKININNYILPNYETLKLPVEIYKIVFNTDDNQTTITKPQIESHTTQLDVLKRCNGLTFPFNRNEVGVAEMVIESANILVEPNEEFDVKKVVQLHLNIEAFPNIDYQPGDTISILPTNTNAEVQQLLECMQLVEQANSFCELQLISSNSSKKNAKLPSHVPIPTTPNELLKYCLNIRAVPKKQLLRALSECCSDVSEQKFLNCLSSKEGKSFYEELLLLENHLNLLDILRICPTCKPKLELLVEHLPRLLPRPYSIANSPLESDGNKTIKIIYSIFSKNPGVTTQMLDELVQQQQQQQQQSIETTSEITNNKVSSLKIVAYFRDVNSKFRFTKEIATETKQIFIGIGTGLAPFLGFLLHKEALQKTGLKLGESWLFVGAPTKLSILYSNQLSNWMEAGILNECFKCCSREPGGSIYRYINHFIITQAKDFSQFLMQENTKLYICADGAKISKSIEAAIIECLKMQLKMPTNSVKELINNWKTDGKYCEDIWT